MNSAYLLMSMTLTAGQETAPPPVPVPAPAVVQPAPTWPSPAYGVPNGGGSGCVPGSACAAGIAPGCSDPCPCEGRKGLFGRRRKGDDCDCSPKAKERRRLFHGFTTSASDDCGGGRGGLLSRLFARFHRGDDGCDSGCGTVGGCGTSFYGGPTIGGCALPPVPAWGAPMAPGIVPSPTPTETPKPMEKPKETPKTNGTTNVSLSLPAPTPLPVPAIPVLADKKSPF